MIIPILKNFIELVDTGLIDIYNEFSLQHELGIYLRDQLPDYKIEFERNTKFFHINGTVKHEIDIVIYNEQKKYAVELKFPCNGQYPEQMYSFVKDILFMEQLNEAGFDRTYCFTMVRDHNFYSGKKCDGIYSFFRDHSPVRGVISKPTGKKNENLSLHGEYFINWIDMDNLKYYIVEI